MPRLTPAVLRLAGKFKIVFGGVLEVEDYGRFIVGFVVGLINEERIEDVIKDAVTRIYEGLTMEKKKKILKIFIKTKSNLVDIPILLDTITTTVTVVLKSELNRLQFLASEQNHKFCNENIDIITNEIFLLFSDQRKNDFIEELYYRLNEKQRIFVFEEIQSLIVL